MIEYSVHIEAPLSGSDPTRHATEAERQKQQPVLINQPGFLNFQSLTLLDECIKTNSSARFDTS